MAKKRLQWYTLEASKEEYNEQEVLSLIELLKTLEKGKEPAFFQADAGLERFWKYCREKQENQNRQMYAMEEEACERIPDSEKSRSGKRACKNMGDFLYHRRKAMSVAAAALAVLVLAGSTIGVYATKEKGGMLWLHKDKQGSESIILPKENEGMMEDNMVIQEVYHSLAEVPVKYQELLWLPEQIADGMKLHYVEVSEEPGLIWIAAGFRNEATGYHLKVVQKNYYNDTAARRTEKYGDTEIWQEQEYEGVLMDYFKVESEDDLEYIINFYDNGNKYSVQGNLPLETVEAYAKEYAEAVKSNK